MSVRFIQADLVELKDRFIVIKSNEADRHALQGIKDAFTKAGYPEVIVMLISEHDSIESIDKESAIRILKNIAEGPDEPKPEKAKCEKPDEPFSDGDRTDQ